MTERMKEMSVRLATAIDRRRFIRRSATASFAGIAALAAGRLIDPAAALGYSSVCESPSGPGCPTGCGQSRCCASQSGSCHCSNGNGGCQNNGGSCRGLDGDWGGQSCWTCSYTYCADGCIKYRQTTTCCDCKTSGCDSDNICIAYSGSTVAIGSCCSATTGVPPVGTVVGVFTGDPATSWGVQPELAPIDR